MYIITSKTRNKMKRDKNSQAQLKAERQYYYREQGLTAIKPLKGQTEEQTFEEIKRAGSMVKDMLDKKREENRQAMLERQKAKKGKTLKEAADRYFKAKKQ